MLDKLDVYLPVNFFSFSPVGRFLVADPRGTCIPFPHFPCIGGSCHCSRCIIPEGTAAAHPWPPPLLVPCTLLYCYYNDTLLCLNIWVRILLKPYSVCGDGPAELVKTPINIYYGKPTSDIVYKVFNEFKGVYREDRGTRHF